MKQTFLCKNISASRPRKKRTNILTETSKKKEIKINKSEKLKKEKQC